MIAAVLMWALRSNAAFIAALNDPIWRFPLIAMLLSASGLATYPIAIIWGKEQNRRNHHATQKKLEKRLGKLTPSEMKVLRRYIAEEHRAVFWDRMGGTVDALARDGILTLMRSVTGNLTPDLYAISEEAWDHLRKHPEIIELEHNPEE